MKSHPKVQHPDTVLKECRNMQNRLIKFNDIVLEWIANHILGSILFFDVALIIPLLAIPAPDYIKAIVIILSSNWVQLWALFALQHTQKKADAKRDAKSDTDYVALTHIANQLDKLVSEKK